jgi:UDP:flavonoid glycosyltransferase YjiC (YdhE family)
MRVLFATTTGTGHVAPLVPFAHACLRAGHEVLVAGQAGAAPLAARAGLAFRAVPEPTREALARFRAGQRGLSPAQAMTRAFTDLYIGIYGGAALPGMLAALEEWRPDVVVRESAEVASAVAADRLRIPHAEVAIALSSSAADRMQPLAEPRIDALRAGLGMKPGGRPPLARLTRAPRSLDEPPAPAVHRFRDPVAALGELPARRVVTIGGTRGAVALVTDGGAGSTLGGLAAGVPLAMLPRSADQHITARKVAATGAGMVVKDVASLGAAVRTLLRDHRYRERARRVAAEILALPPVDDAVDVLSSVARCAPASGSSRPARSR